MSKTNHRVNRDRDERLSESKSHKGRRDFKQQAIRIADLHESEDEFDVYELEEEVETFEKIRKR